MRRNQELIIIVLITLLLHSEIVSIADATVYRFLHDIIQYNVAGLPVVHQQTEWDFDPDVGKQRRIQYERENGRFGKYAIAKVRNGHWIQRSMGCASEKLKR